MLWLFIAVVLIGGGILKQVFDWWLDRPLTDWDRNCARIDAELDELWAQAQVRPYGSVNVTTGSPWRHTS